MTYKILTDDTKKVIYRSNVRSAQTKEDRNKCVDLLGGEEVAPIIKSSNDEDESPRKPMPIFDPTDLVGCTFLMDPQENGERYRTKILEALVESEEQLAKHPDHIKFICSVNDDMYEEVLTYNEILEYIAKNEEHDDDQAIVWKFKRIAGHQGPLKKRDPGYNGSKFNVLVEWETGESMYEPLDVIAADDPITCAIYAKEKGLLDEPGWRRFKLIAKLESRLLHMTNQAKLRSFRHSPKYKFSYQVPNNHAHLMTHIGFNKLELQWVPHPAHPTQRSTLQYMNSPSFHTYAPYMAEVSDSATGIVVVRHLDLGFIVAMKRCCWTRRISTPSGLMPRRKREIVSASIKSSRTLGRMAGLLPATNH